MLKLIKNESSLKVEFNNNEFLSFKINDPIIWVSKGHNSFSMSRGSFKIKEYNETKVPLILKEIKEDNDKIILILNIGKIEIINKNDCLFFNPINLDKYNRLFFKLNSNKDEHFYGGGEVFATFDLKGKKHNVWVAEHINVKQIVKKILKVFIGLKNSKKKQRYSNYETYYAQPTFISSNKYFFHSFGSPRVVFNFKKKVTIVQIDAIERFVIGFADTFEELTGKITSIIGRQDILPEWIYNGQILGIQGGSDIMMEKYHKVKEKDGKVCGIWIQDWEGRRVTAMGKQLYWNWEWDKQLYKDLDKRIKELNEEGVKVLGYCNPFLAIEKPLYKDATAKGYCVKDKDGKDYLVKITTFPAAMVDLTNPNAYNWLKNIIKKNMIEFGFSGWMADFAEYLPTDCVLYSKENAEYIHNSWPSLWAKLNKEAIHEAYKDDEIMFFTRSGHSDSLKYSKMMWNGDNHPDFSYDFGLPSIIPAMLSLTCVGMGLSHSDIGGYTTIFNIKRDQEVYYRWFEMNAFSLLMRGHEGLNPDLNVQFDDNEEILNHCAKMGRIHAQLKEYLMDAVKYNNEKGVGVIRPLFFYYDESEAYKESYEYLLGRDILVAPVLRPRQRVKSVYLPKDNWIHLYSGKEYKGGMHKINCPIGETPVFIRKDSKSDVYEKLRKVL